MIMVEFWLPAALLLVVAMAFLAVPLMRSPDACPDHDRTAHNVTLYRERLRELQAQHQAGRLDTEQFEAARADTARLLLNDTDTRPVPAMRRKPGLAVAWAAALLVPLCGAAAYVQWGSLDQVVQARAWQGRPAGHAESLDTITARLHARLQARPDSADTWYLLGLTYVAHGRHADAAQAFERTASLAQRPPEVLGQWAQALYFAADEQWSDTQQALIDEALARDPAEATSLTLAGMHAFEQARYADAAAYWERLAAALPPDDPGHATISDGIARARALAAAAGGQAAP